MALLNIMMLNPSLQGELGRGKVSDEITRSLAAG
jgi:hypothetical protein